MFVCSVVGSSWLYAQRLLSASCLNMAGDILYCRAWDEASESGLLRATLPMEVVTMSIYVTPVTSSLMMWLVLMVEIWGVTTTPMDMVPWGASKAISKGSGIQRQAVTPVKPCGWVNGHTTANACTGEEGLDGVGVFNREAGAFTGTVQGSWIGPTFGLEALDGWEISPVATTGWDGCRTFSNPKNFGLLLSVADSFTQGVLGMWWLGSPGSDPPPS